MNRRMLEKKLEKHELVPDLKGEMCELEMSGSRSN
jgi:hypothetical protein